MIREKSRDNFQEIDKLENSKIFKAYITIWSKLNFVVLMEQTQMNGEFMRVTMK